MGEIGCTAHRAPSGQLAQHICNSATPLVWTRLANYILVEWDCAYGRTSFSYYWGGRPPLVVGLFKENKSRGGPALKWGSFSSAHRPYYTDQDEQMSFEKEEEESRASSQNKREIELPKYYALPIKFYIF